MPARPIPNAKVAGAYGIANPTPSATTRVIPSNQQVPGGSPQRREQFVDPDIPPAVARALVSVQQSVDVATSQAKGMLFARHNIVRNWVVTQGSANGVNPNVVNHGLGRRADGYIILAPRGGFVTNHAMVGNTNAQEDSSVIRIWTQRTLFAGSTSVTVDFLIFTYLQ